MRLWSLSPSLLDSKGLVALWREGLLAQKVLQGGTRGYRAHPQLDRFWAQTAPEQAIAAYLASVQTEATRRGYRFDHAKIGKLPVPPLLLPVTQGQLNFERLHLEKKLTMRDPVWLASIQNTPTRPHPLFTSVAGGIELWERP